MAPDELWQRAKPLLLPYDGGASQLYVLDLPVERLRSIVERFDKALSQVQVSVIRTQGIQSTRLTPDLLGQLAIATDDPTYHILDGKWDVATPLNLWLHVDKDQTTFDAELYFFSDLMFPYPEDDLICKEQFLSLAGLAESFRKESTSSECALSASEVGDPKQDRDQPWTLFW